jgi:hypothetical protein
MDIMYPVPWSYTVVIDGEGIYQGTEVQCGDGFSFTLFCNEAEVKRVCSVVNQHDTLVAALKEARETINTLVDETPAGTWIDTTCDIVEMTLEQADKALAAAGLAPVERPAPITIDEELARR